MLRALRGQECPRYTARSLRNKYFSGHDGGKSKRTCELCADKSVRATPVRVENGPRFQRPRLASCVLPDVFRAAVLPRRLKPVLKTGQLSQR
jgi:hypothetical protein